MIAIAIALGILAALGVGLLSRQEMTDRESKAEREAKPLLAKLPARYDQVGALLTAIQDVSSDRSILAAGTGALTRWNDVANGSDLRAAISAANDVESIIARAKTVVVASPKLLAAAPIQEAFAAIDAAVPVVEDVSTFNEAVQAFQDQRNGLFRSLVASVFDVQPIPRFLPSEPPPEAK